MLRNGEGPERWQMRRRLARFLTLRLRPGPQPIREAGLKESRASVTPEMLEEYERIQETLKSEAVRPMSGIGFVLPGMLRPKNDAKE